MIAPFFVLTSWLVLAAPAPAPGHAAENARVGPVLAEEDFAWYDGATGRLRPVLSEPDLGGGRFKSWGEWLGKKFDWIPRMFRRIGDWFSGLNGWRVPGVGGLGDLIAIGLVLLVLALLIVVLTELLRRYRPPVSEELLGAVALRAGSSGRIEGLPVGLAFDATDPWAEAVRRRARGDYAGAVVYLFAHQLLSLNRLNLIRLIPGRTGRQLVRSVNDRQLRGWVEPTLRLFEAVYYGHRPPSPAAFEAAWSEAEAFQRRIESAPGAVA